MATAETATCIVTIEIVMCLMGCRKYHLHDCNRDSQLHNFNKNCRPHTCCRNFDLHKCCRNVWLRSVKSSAFGGWHPHLTLISSTHNSIDISSRIPMILPMIHWSRFWFVSIKITGLSFPSKSCVVWLPCTLFVRLCTCLMMAWIGL